MRTSFCWSAKADYAFDDDQSRFLILVFKSLECTTQRGRIVGIINIFDSPPKSFESAPNVFTKRKVGFTFDCYFIVVVNPAEIRKLKVAGK